MCQKPSPKTCFASRKSCHDHVRNPSEIPASSGKRWRSARDPDSKSRTFVSRPKRGKMTTTIIGKQKEDAKSRRIHYYSSSSFIGTHTTEATLVLLCIIGIRKSGRGLAFWPSNRLRLSGVSQSLSLSGLLLSYFRLLLGNGDLDDRTIFRNFLCQLYSEF